jgi:hypothetical protein
MNWINDVLNFLYLVVAISGSVTAVLVYEEWRSKR